MVECLVAISQLNHWCLAITLARDVGSRGDVIATISVDTDSCIVIMTSSNVLVSMAIRCMS